MLHFKMAVDKKTNARIVMTLWNDSPELPLKERVKYTRAGLAAGRTPAELKMARESIFETSARQAGICLFAPGKVKGVPAHQWMFFFPRRDKTVLQVGCLTPADATYDRLIEATMKSFRFYSAKGG